MKRALVLLFAALSITRAESVSPARVALVIGNNNYKFDRLRNAVNDANSVERALHALGFTRIVKVTDASYSQMRQALAKLKASIAPDTEVWVYFSGHGVQIAGTNYFLPVDIEPGTSSLERNSVSISDIREATKEAGVRVFAFDACRDNAVAKGIKPATAVHNSRSVSGGANTIIFFATAEGEPASDTSRKGNNGIFAYYLAKELLERDDVDSAFRQVIRDVNEETGGAQTPMLYSGLTREIRLTARPAANAPAAGLTQPDLWPAIAPTEDLALLDRVGDATWPLPLGRKARARAEELRAAAAQHPPDPAPQPQKKNDFAVNPRDGQMYRRLEAGTVVTKCERDDGACPPGELETRQTIATEFLMGVQEVSQAAFAKLMGADKVHSLFRGDSLPVHGVTYKEARAFCEAAGGALPSYTQWHYVATADERMADVARKPAEAPTVWTAANSGLTVHAPAESSADALGIFDLLGNVWEIVVDDERKPSAPVLAGGSAFSSPALVRASTRVDLKAEERRPLAGFRCVLPGSALP